MALKAVHVTEVPKLDQGSENAAMALSSSARFTQYEDLNNPFKFPKFAVVGHRGSGMNVLQSSDRRMKAIKENSIRSFNAAAKLHLDFIEFDVQVTKDDCPIIFHDNFILTREKGAIIEKRVTDITLAEFLSYGPQKEYGKVGKPLYRKLKDGTICEWKVEEDDPLCTLQECLEKVDISVGFNIEMKFDDQLAYKEEQLKHILQVVIEHAKDRPIIFSSFQPDAALLIRKLQTNYPVFFLTNGGCEIYIDMRRNSMDEAIKVCIEGGLQGIVSQVKAILRDSEAVARIHEAKLSLITYGQLNNVPEVVYVQYLLGVKGIIVDLVHEITESVSTFSDLEEDNGFIGNLKTKSKLQFSKDGFPFLLKLIPELMQS